MLRINGPFSALAVFGGCLSLVPTAQAVPTAIPYLGRLTFASGAPFQGQATISAALYGAASPTPGETGALWGPHNFGLMEVDQGLLGFVVGGSGSPPLDAADLTSPTGVWLLVTINNIPMLPAQQLYSVPFAIRAAEADRVGGLEAADIATVAELNALATTLQQGPVQLGHDEQACTGTKAGTLRWTGAAVQVCDGEEWTPLGAGDSTCAGPTGQSAATAARRCNDILQAGCSTGSGIYWLDPDGPGGASAQEFYCDMVNDGGGWTKMMSATVPWVFGDNNWQGYNLSSPAATNYSAMASRFALASQSGCYEFRLQMGNGSGWTAGPTYTTGWRQCHDPFTATTDGTGYTHLFGPTPITCGGFNGLHHKYQANGYASEVDLNDNVGCWYMMVVPRVLYNSAYLHGYLGAGNYLLQWQSLWIR